MVTLLLSLLVSPAAAEHPLVLGQTFPTAPTHLGPLLDNPGKPSIDKVQAHLQAQDLSAALWEATRLTETVRWGRDRDIAWMVQGLIHREEGRHNLASAAFTKARSTKGPLKPIASYYEAEQDLERGKYFVAARECETYRKTWPQGRHAQDCHRVMAIAYARAGSWSKARSTAAAYDAKNSHAPIGEQVALTLTLQLLREAPKKAIGRLQDHSVSFTAPLTGRIAAESLRELQAQGLEDATLPMDMPSRQQRARSLRNTKQTHEAWRAFADIVMDAEDDPALTNWVEANADTFGWRTRNWDFLEKLYANDYADRPSGELAWKRYRVLARGGRYTEAIEAAKFGLTKHKSDRNWRGKHEALGQTFMLGGDYAGAREHFDAMARLGGWTGRRGQFYAAFAGVMAADEDDKTLERLAAIVDRNASFAIQARYWRAQVYDRNEQPDLAAADRALVIADDPDSWYGALLRSKAATGDPTLVARDGTWPGTPWQDAPVVVGEPASVFAETFAIGRPATKRIHEVNTGFGLVTWSGLAEAPIREPAPAFLKADPNLPPGSYLTSALFDPSAISRSMSRWATAHKAAWPELEAAFELARGGLYDHSGPLFSAIYEEWRAAYKNRNNRKHAAARAMKLDPDGWRNVFKYVRDHHHTARFHHSAWEQIEDPQLAREAKRIAYPLAHDRYVWSHSREHGVDPFLVLGLMRQESTYNSIARSPVGARGAMQIMPRTGHLVANITNDLQYDAGDLEDPTFAVGHGIRYLGLLMERFDGAYPLAIASYNGGPFNVSSWRKGTGTDMPMDAFVEHIPFRETRDYVKRVSAGYSAYLSLYAQPGTLLVPPETPRGDHEDVIDF